MAAPSSVVIALGSNLGDSAGLLRRAIGRLAERSATPVACSSFWRTSPVDCPPGSPPFVNAVVLIGARPGETPESLLAWLQELEREFGRRPKVVLNEARPLDLDLIDWAGESRGTAQLTLPHPRALERQFVMRPLAEIDPDRVLAGGTRSVAAVLRDLKTDEALVRMES